MIVYGIKETHSGKLYLIDSTSNNVIYEYDSLLNTGYFRASATGRFYPDVAITNNNFTLVDSLYSFHLQPNAVALFEAYIPNISVILNTVQNLPDSKLFPYRFSKSIRIEFSSQLMKDENINIINPIGELVKLLLQKDQQP